MAEMVFYGAGVGALHAVTGPDHLLSLGPAALRARAAAWRVGLVWGWGHALGALLLALPLLVFREALPLAALTGAGERLAGAALLLTAWGSWRALRRPASEAPAEGRSALWVGLLHGATGASALIWMLPIFAQGRAELGALFLAAFGLGSAAAMAGLTAGIARLGAGLRAPRLQGLQRWLARGAFALGLCWLVGG